MLHQHLKHQSRGSSVSYAVVSDAFRLNLDLMTAEMSECSGNFLMMWMISFFAASSFYGFSTRSVDLPAQHV